jgi:hypothetical protein
MLRSRKLVGILAAVCAVGLQAGTASANLDLNETAAALALPIITSSGPEGTVSRLVSATALTYMTVTNASSEGLTLAINVIDGDYGRYHSWGASSFSCYVTGRETTLFTFSPDGPGRSKVDFECSATTADENSDPSQLNIRRTEYFNHATGIMFLAIEQSGKTVSKNVIFGDWVAVDYSSGSAYSGEAIGFQGVDPFAQSGDRVYKFNGKEYSAFPQVLATNFIAPNLSGLNAELILFTLDGTVGQAPVPVDIHYNFYNDDELKRDGEFDFDCFAIIDLARTDSRFLDSRLGSPAGHLEMEPRDVTNGNAAHDRLFGDNNGVRNSPFHGWIAEVILKGGSINGGPASAGVAAWARTLAQSVTSHVPAGTDTDTFKAN